MNVDPDPPISDDPTDPQRWSGRWWLMRLTFSFLIVGAVAAYEGWHAHERGDETRAVLLMLAALAGITLAAAGLQARHHRRS